MYTEGGGEPGLLATNGTGVKNLEMGLPSADKGYLALTAHSEMRLIKKESVVQRSSAHPILLRNRVQRQASDTSYRRVDNHGRVLNLPPFCRYLSRVLQDMPGEKQISAESCPTCKHVLTQQHCYHSALCSGNWEFYKQHYKGTQVYGIHRISLIIGMHWHAFF